MHKKFCIPEPKEISSHVNLTSRVFNSYCWMHNTYYLPVDEDIPADGQLKPYSEIRYYQWVPAILLVQALLLHLPYVLWRKIITRSGIDLSDFIDSGMSLAKVSNRRETLLDMTEQLHR
jgi:innexin